MDPVRDEDLLEKSHGAMKQLSEVKELVYEAYTSLMASCTSREKKELEELRSKRSDRLRVFNKEITEWGDMLIQEVFGKAVQAEGGSDEGGRGTR